jgi:ketosteroid isomerase-like protein
MKGFLQMTNLTLVERFYSAVSQGDSETIRRSLSPDIEWVQTEGFPNGKTYQGIDDVFKELFPMFSQEWHQWRSDVHEYCDAGTKL